MSGLALIINDVIRTSNVLREDGVSLSWLLGGSRNTAKFTIYSADGSYIPECGHDVQWFDSTGQKIWCGVIYAIQPRAIYAKSAAGVPVITVCNCVGYEASLDKRMVAIAVYENKTCKQIIDDIFNVQLPEGGHEDINYALSTVNDGATLDRYVIDHQRVNDILDDLATRSNCIWWVGRDKELYFVPRTTSPASYRAPFTITDAAPNARELSVSRSRDGYRNRQHIRISYNAFAASTQTIIGDGATTSWTLYSNSSPTDPSLVNYIESIKVITGSSATEEKTFGLLGVDTDKDFYYEQGDSTLTQGGTSPITPYTSDQQIVVTWRHLGGDVITVENGGEIATRAAIESGTWGDSTGIYEHMIDASSEIDAVAHLAYAQAALASRDQIGTEVNGVTDRGGLLPGQVLDINVTTPPFSGSILIDQVDAELAADGTISYSFHGSTTAYDDWVKQWNSVLSQSGSSSSMIGGGAVPEYASGAIAPPPKPTALAVELRTEVVGGVPCFMFHVVITSGGGSTTGFVAQARYFSDAAAQTPITEFVGLTWSDPSTATFDTRWEPLSGVNEYARVRVAAQNAENQLSDWIESAILAKPASPGLVTGIAPAAPISVVAAESAGERWADQNALVYTKISVTVTLPEGTTAKWLTVWAPNYTGNGFDLIGKWYVGETIKFDRIVMKDGATWTVKVAAGNEHGDSDVVESASFQVAPLANSSASGITGASLGNVVYGSGYEGVGTQRWWGLDHVRYTLPSDDTNFWTSQLTVQKVDVNGSAAPDNEGLERVVTEKAGAGLTVDIPILYWTIPDPASAYRYFRFRLYTLSRNGVRVLQTTCWSGASYAQVEVGSVAGPHDVLDFRAGISKGDGTFTASMYWDDRRQRMLIDWACLAPAERSNWSGVQLWIHSPKGYSRAASIPLTEFTRTDDGDLYLYDTIAVEPDSIPDPAENWTLICASVDIYGQVSADVDGNPSGATVTLPTLSNSIYVSSFAAEAVYETSESGDLTFRLRGSWTNAVTPRYKGVRVLMRGWDAGDITVADALEGESSFASKSLSVPSAAKAITLYAVPVYGDGTVGAVVAGTTPSVALTIQRTNGSAGREYASLVTGFSAAVASPAYGTNGQGQRVLRVNLSWTNPSDAKYGGVALYVIWVDGRTYQISGVERGTSLQWSTPNFPSTASNATFYACSVDTNNRRNSYVEGTTPAVTVSIPAVPIDSTGQEYCQNVSNFTATVSYPSTADGTSRAVVTCTFTPPSDTRWGGVEIRTAHDAGDYSTQVKGSATKLSFEIPVGISSTTYNVMAVSYDVNGRINSGVLAYTPYVNVSIGTSSGMLDLSKAKATSYDRNIFTITDGKFKVWAMDGSLIVTGSVTSAKLNATEISVGGGGSKPGKFGIYNASGTQIGFIGVESSYEGAWFKQFRAGGTGAANAPLVCDSSGNMSLNLSASGCKVTMDQASSLGPFVITHISSGRRVWISHNDSYGSGLYVDLGSSFVAPWARFVTTGTTADLTLTPATFGTIRAYGDTTTPSVHFAVGFGDLARTFGIDIDRGSTSVMTLNNMGIKVDGAYEGQTVNIPYTKADATTGTLNFRRGLLVAYS